MLRLPVLMTLALVACDPAGELRSDLPDDSAADTDTDTDTDADTDTDTDTGEPCPEGVICVDSLPYEHRGDTSTSSSRDFDAYSCSPGTDEGGPELIYRVTIPSSGVLGVAIDDSTPGVDIDAHILSERDARTCLDRGNDDAHAPLEPGYTWVIADTWVSGDTEQAGPYTITMGLSSLTRGDCAMEEGWLGRVGDGGEALRMPATGPMALEAHLVTDDDDFGSSWPNTITDGVEDHWAMSQEASGFVMVRDQPWCPQESCEYGQGACGHPVPVEDEHWCVNMYWSSRPAEGTRMILMNDDGRAVVVAAGYETGPGDLDYIGGVTEEAHAYLGSSHGSSLTLGFAVDQSLPLGPIACQ
jgi:hypothetical protein